MAPARDHSVPGDTHIQKGPCIFKAANDGYAISIFLIVVMR